MGESLGGVETLISHPASMTHAAIGEKGRKAIGLTDGMVRISVGIEDIEDMIADLEQALALAVGSQVSGIGISIQPSPTPVLSSRASPRHQLSGSGMNFDADESFKERHASNEPERSPNY